MNRPARQTHVSAADDEPVMTTATTSSIAAVPDQIVAETFHKELLETCIDMLLRYTYFNSSGLPKRFVSSISVLNSDSILAMVIAGSCSSSFVATFGNEWSTNFGERLHRRGWIFHGGQCNVTPISREHCSGLQQSCCHAIIEN